MQSLQKQFHDFIHAHHLVKKSEKVLLAVSGGLDSMVMANLFLEEKIPFAVAHCNFGLRGDESEGDEAFVLDWADKNNVNCHVKAFEIEGGSIQLEARNSRYQWFGELAAEHGYDKVATAHHLNDSLETILINLSRGTGIKGIAGIPIKGANTIRPLLFAEKQRLHDYAMDHELEWREDSSNAKSDYDRNLLRHDVVPELLKLNPSLFRSFGLTVERLTYASEIVSRKVDEIKGKYLKEEQSGYRLDLSWIRESSDELILSELLSSFGVNYPTAKEIFEARGKSGKSFPINHWLITMDRNTIFIDKDEVSPNSDLVVNSPGEYNLDIGKLVVEQASKSDISFWELHVGYFDAEKLNFPFEVRRWREGDRFQPLGMTGMKKVSDYLIDEKVPLASKKNMMVIESVNGIAWLVGRRISEAFKISEETGDIIKITLVTPDA